MDRSNRYDISKAVCCISLIIYCFCILYLTNFSRTQGIRQYKLQLFWSYIEWIHGNKNLGMQILANIAVYIPVDFISYAAFNDKANALTIIAIGMILSIVSELGQLILALGLFEFDDIFNNTLGTVIGCFIANILKKIIRTEKLWAVSSQAVCVLIAISGVIHCFS